jgi:site-specific DNA recombinase
VAARASRDLDRQARSDCDEYFDAGCSGRLPWRDRPEAAALLQALPDPDRGFDAIVVGEYERAFAADQFEQLAPTLTRYEVQVWLPEAGGPVEAGSPLHRMLMTVLGAQSRGGIEHVFAASMRRMRVHVTDHSSVRCGSATGLRKARRRPVRLKSS